MQFFKVLLLRSKVAEAPSEEMSLVCRENHSFCCEIEQGPQIISLLAAVDWRDNIDRVIKAWKRVNRFSGRTEFVQEIPAPEFYKAVEESQEGNENEDIADRLHKIGLDMFEAPPVGMTFSCSSTEMPESKRALRTFCKDNLLTSLGEELTRIFDRGASKEFYGHPVHYVFTEETDTEDQLDVLLTALRMEHRLTSNQAISVNLYRFGIPEEIFEKIYRLQQGGTVVIPLKRISEMQKKCDEDWRENLKNVMKLSQKYHNSVLTVLIAPEEMSGVSEQIMKGMPQITFLPLAAAPVSSKIAAQYVEALALKQNLSDPDVTQILDSDKATYYRSEIQNRFDTWQQETICTKSYPAYEAVTSKRKVAAEEKQAETQADPLDELEKLIGLSEAKKIIHRAIDYNRAQKLFASRGFPSAKPGMHMVFLGNPGTAKTTVARLVGQICKKYGLLSNGELIEVGRKDLVGQYVGWTAKSVEEVFKKAKGNVLFIDEAYSLLEDKKGMFGDEAINTIVEQMENVREDTLVILAGYPEQMNELLDRNEGLRSRISFHVNFPDYSEDELCAIFDKFLAEQGRALDLHAQMRVHELIRNAMGEKNFGNGRFVRSMLEKALMQQASRLMVLPEAKITDDDIRLLLAEDFEAAQSHVDKVERRAIGFAC